MVGCYFWVRSHFSEYYPGKWHNGWWNTMFTMLVVGLLVLLTLSVLGYIWLYSTFPWKTVNSWAVVRNDWLRQNWNTERRQAITSSPLTAGCCCWELSYSSTHHQKHRYWCMLHCVLVAQLVIRRLLLMMEMLVLQLSYWFYSYWTHKQSRHWTVVYHLNGFGYAAWSLGLVRIQS